LQWDNFRATDEHYFSVWFRARKSGYVFNYNYDTVPYNQDRDMCDDWDDDHDIESKRGDFSYFFDECENEVEFFAWRQLNVVYTGNTPYTREIWLDNVKHSTDSLDADVFLVQRMHSNEFFLGSYRGVHNFFSGFIYGFEYGLVEPHAWDNMDGWCAHYVCDNICQSMCDWD
jgi:hypothetical protein